MKVKIIAWSIVAFVALGFGAILIQNKETLQNRIVKDEISIYPVTVTEATSVTAGRQVNFAGTTEAFNDIELLSETQGRVLGVNVENGVKISKGDLIAKVDDELLRANFKLAESLYQKGKKDFERYDALYKEGNISINDLENARISLKNAEAQYIIAHKYLKNALIVSPINGVIARRYINVGSTLAPGTPVANIVDISRLKVTFSVPEKDAKDIRRQMNANLTTDLYPGDTFIGKVVSVGIKADEAHNYPVEILLNNSDMKFSSGMYLDVSFDFVSRETLPSIHRNALLGSVKNPQVYVAVNGKAVLKNIVIAAIEGDAVLIKSGINYGDKIIIGGRNNIEDGSPVSITNN